MKQIRISPYALLLILAAIDEDWAAQAASQAQPGPPGKAGVGLGFAVSEIGADHLDAYLDTLLSNPGSVSFQD